MNELDSLVESAKQLFAQSATPAELENAKAQFLGKSGRVTELMKGMAQLSVEEKKSRGAAINLTKQAIEAALTARRQALADAELQAQLKAEALDVSLPGRQRGQGGLHPVSLTLERIEGIFSGTLAYLFNRFDGKVPFSELVRQAKTAGYTEPDPRDDLAGTDVARKLVILGREMDLPMELDAVAVQWFFDHYTPDKTTRSDWRVSPIRATSLAGLPPGAGLRV